MATITNLKFAIDSSYNGAGIKAARGDLKLLNEDLRRVQNTRVRIEVDVNDRLARAKMRRLHNDYGNTAAEIRVDADTARAEAQLDMVARDRTMNLDVDTHGLTGELKRIQDGFKQTNQYSNTFGNNASMAMRLAKIGAVAFAASLVILPGLIQVVGAAMTIGLAGAFVAVAAIALKENQQIVASFQRLKDQGIEVVRRSAAPMIDELAGGLDLILLHVKQLEPAFTEAFGKAGAAIEPFVEGLMHMIENAMPGVNKMLGELKPLMAGVEEGFKNFGTQMSRMFAGMAEGAHGIGQSFNVTFTQLGVLMANFGVAAGQMADKGAALWDGFLGGFNNFVSGYLDGMVQMVNENGPEFGQFWKDFGTGVGNFLREALPGLGRLGATIAEHLGPAVRDLGGPLGTLVSKFADGLVPAIDKLAPQFDKVVNGIVAAIDFVSRFGDVLGPTTVAVWLLNKALKANPIMLVITLLVTLGFWLADLEQKTHVFSNAWKSLTGLFDGAGDKFQKVGDKLKAVFGPLASETWTKIKEGFNDAIGPIKEQLSGLGDTLKPLWDQLQPALRLIGGLFGAIASGAWGAFNGAIKPVFAFIGDIISEVIQVIKGLIQFITGALQTIKGFATFFINLFKLIAGLVTGNGEAVKNAFAGIKRSIGDIIGGIGKMAQGVWSVVTAIWDSIFSVVKRWIQAIWGIVSGFVKGVIGFFTNLWDVLVGHSIVPDMMKAIWDWFMWLPRKIVAIVSAFVDAVINFFQNLWNKITEKWEQFKVLFQAAWDAFWNLIKTVVSAIWDWIQDRWNTFWGNINLAWEKFKAVMQAAWDAFWNLIKNVASAIWDSIKWLWDNFWGGIKIIWEKFSTAIRTAWDIFWNTIKDAAKRIWDWIKDRWNDFWNGISDRWNSFKAWLEGVWNTFWNWVKDHVSGVWDAIVSKFEAIKTKIGDIIQGMVDKVRDIWNTITGIFQAPVDAVKGIWNSVAGALGLTQFAEGGEVGGYATGGAVFGAGTGTSDSIPAYLSNGEHVWTAAEVQAAGGQDAVYSMRQEVMAGSRGQSQRFADGGAVEWMWARVKEMSPAMQLTSSYRDSNDFHGQGKAVDVSNGYDTTPEMEALTKTIFDRWGKGTLELIHNPSPWNIKNGAGVGDGYGFYGAGTMDAHRNHVHWAVPGPLDGQQGAAIPGGSTGMIAGPSPEQIAKHKEAVEGISRVISDTIKTTATMSIYQMNRAANPGFVGPILNEATELTPAAQQMSQAMSQAGIWNPAGDVHGAGTQGIGMRAIEKLDAALASQHTIGGEIPTGERAAIIAKALEITNTPPPSTMQAWMSGMNTLITRESNWNSGAVNDYDINAQQGNASRGLAQVIPTTFEANKAPGFNNIDAPVDNVAASINYIKRRYGTIENVQQANANMPPLGYAGGTSNAQAGWHLVGEAGPEMVQFRGGEQVKTFDEIVTALKSAATKEGREVSTKVSAELKLLADKLGQMNLGGNEVVININIDGAQDAMAVVESVRAQLVPQLEMLLRQRVGAR